MTGRLGIDDVFPVVGARCHPAKTVVGEHLPVEATIWREGHEPVSAAVVWRGPSSRTATRVPMTCADEGTDRWQATVVADRQGMWTFQVEAWSDPWLTWRRTVEVKLEATVAPGATGSGARRLANDLERGARLLERQAHRVRRRPWARILTEAAAVLRREDLTPAERAAPALSPAVQALFDMNPPRELLTRGARHEVWADRDRALHGAWYEVFPRSTGGLDRRGRPVHGSFASTAADLPRIADMGFDVVYLPPVHPIGEVNRKGRNNALRAAPGDVGSPWAIGSREGGHDAVHPALGDLGDFDALVAEARLLGLEIALDLALQCAPDHPWVEAHPEWFTRLPDGSVAHAENPPKLYEDIYPLNFDNDPEGLYAEILRVVEFWIEHGVRIFRVDNPHTKPLNFWNRLIWSVKERHPDVLFLAEAFTRPAMLKGLAKLGFSQSYTYFTWRDSKAELTEYLTELAASTHFLRPNLFVNTPDILPLALQHAGPSSFAIRAALAALLSPTWGMYSGFELGENLPVEEGSEEFLDSEKYQLRTRDYEGELRRGRSIAPWVRILNRARHDHPALQGLRTLRFHKVDNDDLLVFSKTDPPTGDTVVCVVTLNPAGVEKGTMILDLPAIGLAPGARFEVRDEVSGRTRELGARSTVRIDPEEAVAQILTVVGS
ncbi:alpha-1,4-glucan--maltose-1-phosphate maltosyltransferase [Streptosporangium sp. NPDC001559]|uniref:alpha-1,4-glucan--maltose-1-phosphate maltosyltransferase n=1 Tax=Streptosporangium sp. NPDC001559 TaxID=3366187 RepID=UPI0036EB6858